MQSDEIRLYAKDMKRSYAEYGTETRIEPTEATGIYSLVFITYVLNKSSKTFGTTSDQIRLMTLIQTL